MAFLKRNRPTAGAGPEPFWAWWNAEGAEACAVAIEARTIVELVGPLSDRVAAVDPGLAWELGPGQTGSRHCLVVTAEGDPTKRAAARRWLRAAPPASETWEYADSRRAGGLEGTLELGGQQVPLADVQVGVTPSGNRVDLVLHHASFVALPDDDARMTVAFLALDAALGETDVETWVREVTASPTPVSGAVLLSELPGVVARLRGQHLDAHGDPTWAMLQGTGPDGPLLAMVMVPLASAVAPELDDHLAVTVPYGGRTPQGLPDEQSLTDLRALEEHITERLGGSARLVVVETSAGTRVLHYYADSTTPAREVTEAAVRGWPAGRVRVTCERDPGWSAVRHFRG